jgi:uncharacterized protein YecE (DUF72 family)
MTKVADPALLERRAKRERRREKQRAASIDRAKKMHAARLALAGEKSHYLPSKVNSPIRQDSQFQIGCSGWFYWHWRGGFYPADMPNAQWFDHYSRHFSTVELNAPFYSWPTIATVKSWLQQADGKAFLFTVKACELMTHTKRFIGTKELVRDFGFIADLLGPHMGCFLFQLPPSYRYAPARLKTIVNQLDPNWRNVVEFRHASWWNEKVYKAFEKAGIIFCSSSAPKLPDELIKTSDEIYIRFHGTKRWYRHDYTGEELNSWSGRIRNSGAKRVWAYFNNDRDGYAIHNAQELLRLLNSPDV